MVKRQLSDIRAWATGLCLLALAGALNHTRKEERCVNSAKSLE
jgi:hypothetical protein